MAATQEQIAELIAIVETRLGERERRVKEREQELDKGAPRTLRDYFAAQALAGLVPIIGIPEDGPDSLWDTSTAERAYALADAMIAARSK